jgi:hypothetical protein
MDFAVFAGEIEKNAARHSAISRHHNSIRLTIVSSPTDNSYGMVRM